MLHVRIDDFDYRFDESDSPIRIGRSAASHVSLANQRVSRNHAELRFRDGQWILADLNSRNGTFSDGGKVDEIVIESDTVVYLGGTSAGVEVLVSLDGDGETQADPAVTDPEGTEAVALAERSGSQTGYGAPRSIIRPTTDVVRIGRASQNDIVLPDVMVSRFHAELRSDDEVGHVLVDLQSHNGTFVNGEAITWSRVQEGDLISIGHHVFLFQAGALEEYVDTGRITFDVSDLTIKLSNGSVLVNNVSFSLDECSLLAILGPSGAGKTSLLRGLTGLAEPSSGTVYYAGRDLFKNYPDLKDKIGFVPQQDIVHPQLTLQRSLEFTAKLRLPPDVEPEQRETIVNDLMEKLGLSRVADRMIEQLSGGQRRRASIATELLTRPSLLVLDEPTSGLDPGRERSVMELLRELANDGRTVIVVTHSVQELDLCDRVLFLAPGGSVAYFGPPEHLAEYFDTDDYPEVFSVLDEHRDSDFAGKFRSHEYYTRFVEEPAREREILARRVVNATRMSSVRGSPLRQFGILLRRNWELLLSDRKALLLLLAQAPVLGLLILIMTPGSSLDLDFGQPRSNASMVLLMIVVSATLMGFLNAVREIVKERAVYLRERMVGLSIVAYVSSKFVLLGGLTILQAAVLVYLARLGQGGPTTSALLPSPLFEMTLAVMICGLAAVALALTTSALVTRSEQALALVSLLLVPQILLAGPVVPLEDRPIVREASHFVSAKWGFSAAASTADLNTLHTQGTSGPEGVPANLRQDSSWEQSRSVWLTDMAALLVLTWAFFSAAILLLRRSDPPVLHRSKQRSSVSGEIGDLVRVRRILGQARGFAPRLVPGIFWALLGLLVRRLLF